MEGSSFGDVPLNCELKLEVWDSPNSAGIVIDAVRLREARPQQRHLGRARGAVELPDEVAAEADPRRRVARADRALHHEERAQAGQGSGSQGVTRPRLARVFWIGAAAILVVAALVALVAVVRGDFSDTDGRILGSLAALMYCGGTGLAGFALAGRGPARALGWTVVAGAAVCLALVLWEIWSYALDVEGDSWWKLSWSAVIVLAAGLMTTTSLLIAGRTRLAPLAGVAGGLASVTAALAVVGVWSEPDSDAYAKAMAALAIVSVLAYFLVPVLQRFTQAGAIEGQVRVLGSLDDIELLAVRSPLSGSVPIAGSLRSGERLALRRRPAGEPPAA